MSEFKVGVYKVVDAFGLMGATEEGWELVQVLTEDTVKQGYMETIPHPNAGQTQSGTWNPDTLNVPRSLVMRENRFLLRQSEESALAVAAQQRGELKSRIDQLSEEARALEDSLTKTRSEADRAREELENASKALGKNTERACVAEERCRAMEADLARVREQVGAQRMKEILGQ